MNYRRSSGMWWFLPVALCLANPVFCQPQREATATGTVTLTIEKYCRFHVGDDRDDDDHDCDEPEHRHQHPWDDGGDVPVSPDLSAGPTAPRDSPGLTPQNCTPPSPPLRIDPAGIAKWGQGPTSDGGPNYAVDGAQAGFSRGAANDVWVDGTVREYCRGAVGRCWIETEANCNTTLSVSPRLISLPDGAGHNVPCAVWIGQRPKCGLPMRLEPAISKLSHGQHYLWLYATAQRQGLGDAAGAYEGTATVVLTLMADCD